MTRRVQHVDGSMGSRALHALKSVSATTAASVAVAGASCVLLGTAVLSDHRTDILVWFEAVASAVTLSMVFVLQHTQTRQELALQAKLDEILRAVPGADNRLISLEAAPDDALDAQEQRSAAMREQAQRS